MGYLASIWTYILRGLFSIFFDFPISFGWINHHVILPELHISLNFYPTTLKPLEKLVSQLNFHFHGYLTKILC